MLCAMNSSLAALEARMTLRKMNSLRDEIKIFAAHARMLNASSKNFDAANLLDVATDLLEKLLNARLEFAGASGKVETLARSLPSRSRNGVGMSPAQQWVPELRAASRQFAAAVRGRAAARVRPEDWSAGPFHPSPRRIPASPNRSLAPADTAAHG